MDVWYWKNGVFIKEHFECAEGDVEARDHMLISRARCDKLERAFGEQAAMEDAAIKVKQLEEEVITLNNRFATHKVSLRLALSKYSNLNVDELLSELDVPVPQADSNTSGLNRALLEEVLCFRKQLHASDAILQTGPLPALSADKRIDFVGALIQWTMEDSGIRLPDILKSASKLILSRSSSHLIVSKDSPAASEALLETTQYIQSALLAENERLVSTQNMYLRRMGRPTILKNDIPSSLSSMVLVNPNLFISVTDRTTEVESSVDGQEVASNLLSPVTIESQTDLCMSDMQIYSVIRTDYGDFPSDGRQSIRDYMDAFRAAFLLDLKEHPEIALVNIFPHLGNTTSDPISVSKTSRIILDLKTQLADAQARLALRANDPPTPDPIAPKVRNVYETLYEDAKNRMRNKQGDSSPRTSTRRTTGRSWTHTKRNDT